MRKSTSLFIFIVLFTIKLLAQSGDTFTRIFEIPVPTIENTGFGEFISGVDFDGDGNVEIYAVNNMLDQGGAELIPRIYKFEKHGNVWDSVWSEQERNIAQQNSWAPITWGDWDKDGKPEIVWGPANYFNGDNGPNLNPPRIVVYEYQGNGSDKMGAQGFGFENPNAEWTIIDKDAFELRPFRWVLQDFDNDGDIELIFAERRDSLRFGVVSVSDIPDNGDGSETWTLEASGRGWMMNPARIYDMAVMRNKIYLIHEDGSVSVVKYDNGAYTLLGNFPDKVPGGSWKSASVVDIDNNGEEEIIVAGWSKGFNNIYVLKEDGDSLQSYTVANLASLIGTDGRLNGGHDAYGDIDGDGNIDFVFGTRAATPDAAIIRLEYQGGDVTQPQSYVAQVIDSLYPGTGVNRYDIVNISNIDDDPDLEVLYTDGNQTGRIPIVILDVQKATSVNDKTIEQNFELKQNYPNPFNPSTTIAFSLSKESTVSLKIYNVLGELVAQLIDNKTFHPGKYSITFNASGLTSGTYLYTLETGGKRISKKMILQK